MRGKGQGTDGQRPADELEYQQRQGNVYQQIHHADRDPQAILQHGTQTIDARRGKPVGEDEEHIRHRRQASGEENHPIGKNLFTRHHKKRSAKSSVGVVRRLGREWTRVLGKVIVAQEEKGVKRGSGLVVGRIAPLKREIL